MEWHAPPAVNIIQKLSGVSPIDMMAVRRIIEPRAAALAATNASAGALKEIAAVHSASVAAYEIEAFERWDAELHQKIFAATRNDLLNHLHEMLRLIRGQELWLAIKRRSFSPERRNAYCQEHGALVAALLRRDAEAAAIAIRAHLENSQPQSVCRERLVLSRTPTADQQTHTAMRP